MTYSFFFPLKWARTKLRGISDRSALEQKFRQSVARRVKELKTPRPTSWSCRGNGVKVFVSERCFRYWFRGPSAKMVGSYYKWNRVDMWVFVLCVVNREIWKSVDVQEKEEWESVREEIEYWGGTKMASPSSLFLCCHFFFLLFSCLTQTEQTKKTVLLSALFLSHFSYLKIISISS